MPAEYGGMEMDTNTNTLISEALGPAGSITVSMAAHTGSACCPSSTMAQKPRNRPTCPIDLRRTQGAYCLTEPGSGSDALAAKTRADLSADGTTPPERAEDVDLNAGFADIFIVFAKINGEQFTGFIVDRNTPGITLGEGAQDGHPWQLHPNGLFRKCRHSSRPRPGRSAGTPDRLQCPEHRTFQAGGPWSAAEARP